VTVKSAAASTAAIPRYTIAVCKGSALLEETKALLRAWQPTETARQLSARVLQEDLLGKTTAYRVNDIVRRFFAARFLVSDGKPAVLLKRLLENGAAGRLVSDLCLLCAARQDVLLRDVISQVYGPAVAEGRLALGTRDVLTFLREADHDGRIPEPWSEQVKLKVSRGLLRALTDFGLLREVRRGRRETVVYRPTDGAVVYLAYDLHFAGATDAAVVAHRDWAIFGMQRRDVVAHMDRLSAEGWWTMQAAGSVVRITWKYASMDEVVNALAG
jgi:hypothetical protein